MDRKEWIEKVLVKDILNTYNPWKDAQLVKCEVERVEGKKDNFASDTYSIVIYLNKTKEGIEIMESNPIFAKFIVEIPSVREALQSEKQFYNEILWYSKVIPKFQFLIDSSSNRAKSLTIFPKCYYSHYDIDNAVVALEDLRPKKYVLGERNSLGVSYVEKALAAIARSHALAYRWREIDEEGFSAVASDFKESTLNEAMDPMLKVSNERVLKALEKDPEYVDRVRKFREITSMPISLMKRLVRPEGPLATICHGDFCRNNILFSESVVNGEVALDTVLIDFQTVRYASPAIDLSFFFFLSTTPELRGAEFDRLFEFYYDAIINELRSLSEQDSSEDSDKLENVFGLQAFKDDFAAHAVYGYFITSFFLPVMMIDDETRKEMMGLWEDNDEKYLKALETLGGEPVTKRLVDTLKEILDRNYWPLKEM